MPFELKTCIMINNTHVILVDPYFDNHKNMNLHIG